MNVIIVANQPPDPNGPATLAKTPYRLVGEHTRLETNFKFCFFQLPSDTIWVQYVSESVNKYLNSKVPSLVMAAQEPATSVWGHEGDCAFRIYLGYPQLQAARDTLRLEASSNMM